ncbi:capsid assembly scaffolding protein Gp46 family protein [Staphylococcus equorum]|uniref:capsid assembly scaffolding protein Gp46 family protein n=1 Tax=Staphylococcus equorum TaxID=246432 RepID=UPI0007048026|nr:DUF4355 domain-containing protein [Staphylococcus equorum]ALM56783.1 scaffold protein [Staphylococcus equorum]
MNKKLKLNLQHFAEDENSDQLQQQGTEEDEQQSDEGKFSQSELDSQISKAVEKAIQKKEQKHQQELEDAKAEARKEAESYTKLTEKEKYEKELSDREQQIADKERDLNLRALKSDVENDLKEQDLPAAFADTLVLLEDNEKIKEAIQGIKQQFDAAVQAQVKEVTRQNTPESKGSSVASKNTDYNSIQEMARNARVIKSN